MSVLKSKLQAAIRTGKIRVFLLFFAIAFGILMLTKLSKDYTRTITFNIEIENLPIDKAILSDSLHTIDVTLKTYGFKLLRYYTTQPSLAVDIDAIKTIKNAYIWTSNDNFEAIRTQFSVNVEVLNIKPDSIIFNYDTQFVKSVPVVLNDSIVFAPGFNITDRYTVNPDSVSVIGPKQHVEAITSVSTHKISLNNVKKDIDKTIDLIQPDTQKNIKYSVSEVTVQGKVDKFTEGSLQIPIELINVPKNSKINYFPKNVTVLYNTALSNYNKISTDDFKVICDFRESGDYRSYLTPKIVKQPATVKSVRINQKKVEFILIQ